MAIKVWTGAISSDPSVSGNWLGLAVPVTGDRVVFNNKALKAVSGSFADPTAPSLIVLVAHNYPFIFGDADNPIYFNEVDITELVYHSEYSGFIAGADGEATIIRSLKAITAATLTLDYVDFADGGIRLQSGAASLEGSFSGSIVITNNVVANATDVITVESDYNTGGSFTLTPAASNTYGPLLSMLIRGKDWTFDIADGSSTSAPIWPDNGHVTLDATIRPSSYNGSSSVNLNYLNEGNNPVLTSTKIHTYSHSSSAAVVSTASHVSVDEFPLSELNLYGGTFKVPNAKLFTSTYSSSSESYPSYEIAEATIDGDSILDLRAGSELEILTIPNLNLKDSPSAQVLFSDNSVISVTY